MNDVRLDEEAIFKAAWRIEDRELRADYLDRACGDDAALRRRVERLLGACDQERSFLAAPVFPATLDLPRDEVRGGTQVGPYKLLEAIGEGGMGTVYMAEQVEPVRRRVALKIIKPGMDSRQVIARFEAERQALALMDHPNIARVLDAGTTDTGRPFFVMELVRGIPITEYCNKADLGIPERLELFLPVCRAVQHAHQKGIIHRDIKPTNVLVTEHDGEPVPKVIDFGVAKAMGRRLTDKTLYTGFLQLVGTPLYMSPEQAELSGLDVDTRSDVYSLGVLLYELLTGSTPFDRQTFKAAALDEIRRIIREQEPPTPSARLSTIGDTTEGVTPGRHSDLRRQAQAVRGELDWIVMKCLEKDRNRRYETANGLAADIRRHLDNEPVSACPPSAWYRFRKFVSKNRVAMTMAGVVVTCLLVLAIGSTIAATYFVRLARSEASEHERADREADAAQRARDRADRRTTEANLARADADRRTTEAQEVVDFLINDLIGSASPDETQGETVTVDEVLSRADQGIEERFPDRPLIEAAIRLALSETYENLGHYEKAVTHARRAVSLYEQRLGPGHVDTFKARHALGWALRRHGERDEAQRLFEQSYKLTLEELGPEEEATLEARNGLACGLDDDPTRATALHEENLEACRRILGSNHDLTQASMSNLALVYQRLRRYDEAKALLEESVRLGSKEDKISTGQLIRLNNLASLYKLLGEKPTDEFIEFHKEIMNHHLRVLGVEHDRTIASMNAFYWALVVNEYYDEAKRYCEQWIEKLENELGFAHPHTQFFYKRLVAVLERQKEVASEEILHVIDTMIERLQVEPGPEAPKTLYWVGKRAERLVLADRIEEARRDWEQVVQLYERLPEDKLDEGAWFESKLQRISELKLKIAMLYREEGRPDQAESVLREVIDRAVDVIHVELARLFLKNLDAMRRQDDPAGVPLTIDAPFRAESPVADGRIEPTEYGPGLSVDFTTRTNPGRAGDVKDLREITIPDPADLSYQVFASHSQSSLFIAFQVRDQFIDDGPERSRVYENDEIEIYVNGDLHSNDFSALLERFGSREGFQILGDARGQQLTVASDFTNDDWFVSSRRTDDGYILEFEIPLGVIDTQDGPGYSPATTGSFLLMNLAVGDNDQMIVGGTTYATLWNPGEKQLLSLYTAGEDSWPVGLRLTPGD